MRRLLPARRPLRVVAVALAVLTAGCGTTVHLTSADTGGGRPPPSDPPSADVTSAVRADPALHASLPAALRASGVLSLGTLRATGSSQLPYGGQDAAGRQVGFEVDLDDAVAAKLGLRLQTAYGSFATLIPGVQNGKYAVAMGNFGATRAREQVVDFASYLTDGQAFLGPTDSGPAAVRSVVDLCGLTVATTPGSTFQQILTTHAGDCAKAGRKPFTVQYFADVAPIILGLQNGKVGAFFGPTLSVQYDATHVPDTRFLGQLSATTVGLVVGKGSGLAAPIAGAVNALIADGTYARILAKWGIAAGSGVSRSVVDPPTAF